MKKKNTFYRCKSDFQMDLSKCEFLGHGKNGKVFLMPDGKVLKICDRVESCLEEYKILESVKGDKHFPRVYYYKGNSMIRDYVGGICIKNYVRDNGLSDKLALNIIKLLEDFKAHNFTRVDIRCAHIFVQSDESIKIIDPRGSYTMKVTKPEHLFNGLKELKVFKKFMNVLKKENSELYKQWRK
jgi:predicted Ser/Thr protein kinase